MANTFKTQLYSIQWSQGMVWQMLTMQVGMHGTEQEGTVMPSAPFHALNRKRPYCTVNVMHSSERATWEWVGGDDGGNK